MLWYNSIVLNKMFRGILSLSLNLFYLETVAKGSKLNKKEEKLKKSRRPTCCSPGSPAGPASARPVTVQPSCQSSSSPSPRSSCVLDARAPTPATSCFRRRTGGVYECHADPHVSLSSSLTLPLVSLTLSRDGRARSSLPFAVVATRATASPP